MSGKAAATANGELPLTLDKKQEKSSIVELRNGKVFFKQKPISYEKQSETLQEIVSFRAMLEGRISSQLPPLTTFPEEYKPLIAKFSHESDKTLTVLARHIQKELLPTLDHDEGNLALIVAASLPLTTVEDAVKSVLVRNNYGVEAPLGVRLPAALYVWRWEVGSDHMDWLPKNSRERAEARLAERVKARADLKVMLESLPQEERDVILEPKKVVNRLPAKEVIRQNASPNPGTQLEDVTSIPESSKRQGKKKEDAEDEEQCDKSTAKDLVRSRKPQDPEKEKEKQEKKTARLERDRKEKDAQNRSQSLMTKFFSKPRAPVNGSNFHHSKFAGPSKIQSDFERVFKPFVLGKDKVLAPQNWFHDQRRRRRRAVEALDSGAIVIESEDECDAKMFWPIKGLCAMSRQERLNDSLSNRKSYVSLPSPLCHRNPPGFKTYYPNSVRILMAQLSEAEISGNDDLVRELLTRLSDRDVYPAKAYCFHNDARPGYFGTWTRSSKIIGPRRPLAQDTLVFDYSYDSGEEWEEEPLGEDVVDDGDEDDGEDDDGDSDLDSWLVDDDEELDLTALSRGSSPPPTFSAPAPPAPKRKAEDPGQKSGKKRKVVVPLVPFAKGPIWESTIGQPEYEPFSSYKIRLFNDTPCAIDPFTFVSTCLEDYKSHQRNTNPTSGLHSTAVASLHLIPASTSNIPLDLSTSNGGYSNAKKNPTSSKSSFPDAHTTFLLDKINRLQASSITALVEAVYQELRDHKVKKIAIESKIREVGEKCKDKRVWVVKPALMAS